MSANSYAFRVGNVACTVLLDGAAVIGKERLLKRFPSVAEEEIRQAYADIGLKLDEADSSMNILVMQIGAETVLVDTGEAGALMASLAQAGITPEDITQVVLTHTHGDHVLGLLTDTDAPAFPNATYVMSHVEREFWQKRIANGLAEQRPLVDMIEARGLRLIEMTEEIFPGLTAVPLPGHTPGQIGLLLEADGDYLLHLADVLHSPIQFAHPEWSPRFDADTALSVPTRVAALAWAADRNVLTLFYHLPFPGLGRVQRRETGFGWDY